MTNNPIGRQTKYCKDIVCAIENLGHATNNQILDYLKVNFPSISATTIHRATTRLSERQQIAIAPNDVSGSIRYDKNTVPHDHFQCTACGLLVDIDIKDTVAPIISKDVKECCLLGRLIINGTCANCNNGIKENL